MNSNYFQGVLTVVYSAFIVLLVAVGLIEAFGRRRRFAARRVFCYLKIAQIATCIAIFIYFLLIVLNKN